VLLLLIGVIVYGVIQNSSKAKEEERTSNDENLKRLKSMSKPELITEVEKLSNEMDTFKSEKEVSYEVVCATYQKTIDEKDKEIERLKTLVSTMSGTYKLEFE
jgi:archaellum component FlaC